MAVFFSDLLAAAAGRRRRRRRSGRHYSTLCPYVRIEERRTPPRLPPPLNLIAASPPPHPNPLAGRKITAALHANEEAEEVGPMHLYCYALTVALIFLVIGLIFCELRPRSVKFVHSSRSVPTKKRPLEQLLNIV